MKSELPPYHSRLKTKRIKTAEPDTSDVYPAYRTFPLYVILLCGLIVAGFGLYLTISHQLLQGKTLPGRYGQAGGKPVTLFGPWLLIIGIAFCIFPTIELIKRSKKIAT